MTVQFTISDEEQYDRDENCFSIKTNMTEDRFRQVLKLFDVYLADYPDFIACAQRFRKRYLHLLSHSQIVF